MRYLITSLLWASFSCLAAAQDFDERFDDWPLRTSIDGTVVVGADPDDVAVLESLFTSKTDGRSVAVFSTSTDASQTDRWQAVAPTASFEIFDQSSGDRDEWMQQQLQQTDVFIWLSPDAAQLMKRKKELSAFLQRNGKLLLLGPQFSAAAAKFPARQRDDIVWRQGLHLIPDCIVCSATEFQDIPMSSLMTIQPRLVGIEMSADAILVLSGRTFRVLGPGSATLQLPSCEWLPARKQVLKAQSSPRQDPNEYVADLTEWRRDAIERTLEPFPKRLPKAPVVENGTLIIVGGGGMPLGLMDRFIDAAGGKENAKLVYVPCTEDVTVPSRQGTVEAWKNSGVRHATFIHTKDREKANTDQEFSAPLKDATGVWFGGGRQWNFSDSYYGTQTHQLMKEVLKRGGVIGGSSAGASIQARYLARATPIQNFRIMAPGYERGGLGFISGVAIDQHFTQRGRQRDMTQLVNRYPQMLGIGLDEATAIIVQKSVAEVVGKGQVFFYDRRLAVTPDKTDYVSLPEGSTYNLATRTVLVKTELKKEPAPESTENNESIPVP